MLMLLIHTNSSGICPFCSTFKSSIPEAPLLVIEFANWTFPGHHFTSTQLFSIISDIDAMSILNLLSSTNLVDFNASVTLLLSIKAVIGIVLCATPQMSSIILRKYNAVSNPSCRLKASAAIVERTTLLILLACHEIGQHFPILSFIQTM